MTNNKCELCDLDWVDKGLSEEELDEHRESIKQYGRCCDCVEEWGIDGWPDRFN